MNNINNDNDFESLLNESFSEQKSLEIGELVEAVVISIDNEYVFLDLGTRENGLIERVEFLISGKLTISEGDKVEVFIKNTRGGAYYCSRRMSADSDQDKKSTYQAAPKALQDAFNMGILIKGNVTQVLKSGFEVMVMGHRAFCPISQIELRYCENPDQHLNKTYDFKIIEYEAVDNNNIVLSRKKVLEEEKEKLSQIRWDEIQEGKIYQGTVTSVKNYGVFVDIGGIEGLLHVSEISYDKNLDPSTRFKTGDTLDVEVLSIDKEKQRISLSIKSTVEDPWNSELTDLSIGSELKGKVVKLKPFGAFVQLFPGMQGLVHISKMGADKRIDHPKQVVKPGQEVNVRILEINQDEKRISLTMEEAEVDYSKDLKKIKEDQEKQFKDKGTMSSLFDNLDKK